MRNISSKLAAFFFLFSVSSVSVAGPIIDDREWLQPSLTLGFTWFDFNEVCGDKLCTGSIRRDDVVGPDLRGWIWASAEEVGELFRATTPFQGGVGGYASSSFNVVQDFIDNTGFEPTGQVSFLPFYEVLLVGGFTSTLSPAEDFVYGGVVASGFSPFSGELALNGSRISTQFRSGFNDRVGGWLYRSAVSVPIAAPLLLIAPTFWFVLCLRRYRAVNKRCN
ncbi:MAG: hypothetical protein AB8B48_04405 [Pseudomonadales bacterium]